MHSRDNEPVNAPRAPSLAYSTRLFTDSEHIRCTLTQTHTLKSQKKLSWLVQSGLITKETGSERAPGRDGLAFSI